MFNHLDEMKKKNLLKIGTIIGIIILGVFALLTAYTDLPMERFAITVSFWAFGYVIYQYDKNYFYTIAFFLMGILNLISKSILYELSTIATYLSVMVMLAMVLKMKKD